MSATSTADFVSASTVSTVASTLSSSTTHLDWGSKGCTFLLSVHRYSSDIFPLCFNPLVRTELLFVRLTSGTLAILLGFKLGSYLGFTLIIV